MLSIIHTSARSRCACREVAASGSLTQEPPSWRGPSGAPFERLLAQCAAGAHRAHVCTNACLASALEVSRAFSLSHTAAWHCSTRKLARAHKQIHSRVGTWLRPCVEAVGGGARLTCGRSFCVAASSQTTAMNVFTDLRSARLAGVPMSPSCA